MDCADSEVNQTKDPGQPLDVLKGEYRFIGRLLGKNGLGIGDLLLHLRVKADSISIRVGFTSEN